MKFSALIFLMVFSGWCFGNVRVIGNGGGETEMRILSLYSAVGDILNAVSISESQKFLSDQVQTDLRELLENPERDQWKVDFAYDFPQMFELDSEGQSVIFNPQEIEARQFRIDHIVSHAYLSIPPFASVTQMLTVEKQIFPNEDWEYQVIKTRGSRLVVFDNAMGQISMLYDGNGPKDLSAVIQPATACSKNSFELIRAFEISTNRSRYSLTAVWKCGSTSSRSQVRLKKNDNGWEAILFGTRAL